MATQPDHDRVTNEKKRFALELLRAQGHRDPKFYAAKQVFPHESMTSQALFVASNWPDDPIVMAEIDLLRDLFVDTTLPPRTTLARNLWELHIGSTDETVRLKAGIEYGKLMEFYPDTRGGPAVAAVVEHHVTNVLIAPPFENDWQRNLLAEQRKLIADAAEDTAND